MKQCWPAPERNKGPILEVLSRVLPPTGRVLEISSGSGQHAAHFALALPGLVWQPSEVDEDALGSIRAWVRETGLPNLREPLRLDVCDADWGVGSVEAVFNANMIHIAPWECALGLLRGAGRHLEPGGSLVLYGPFLIDAVTTAPSNAAFDADLRTRDPRWGVRELSGIIAEGERAGLRFAERVAMPANNQVVVFRRLPAGEPSGYRPPRLTYP